VLIEILEIVHNEESPISMLSWQVLGSTPAASIEGEDSGEGER
jgi:hypothetical protein